MSQSALLILGNQLFPPKYVKKLNPDYIFMAEDEGLCTHFKYHKHKILFFLGAMRTYAKELKKKGFRVIYTEIEDKDFSKSFEEKLLKFLKSNNQISKLVFFEIEDKFFEKRFLDFCRDNKLETEAVPSPMFLTSRERFRIYLDTRKKPFMKTFYESQRKELGVLVDSKKNPTGGAWSFDKDNRKKLPKDLRPPDLPKIRLSSELQKLGEVVEKRFSDHPGSVDNFWTPTSRKDSLNFLDHFLENSLANFGNYQDAITKDSDFVFHSVLSPMINVGLITPDEVLEKTLGYHQKNPRKIPLNSVEGFVRQLIGWREFVRGIYREYSEKQYETNFWNHKRKLKNCWYTGETGFPVLDDSIKKTIKYGYAHHIERLMVFSNMMLLCEVHPHEAYRWFMELFIDSSDWVMGPNVFGMGLFSDGGIFATKPYICGSNYYLKMSNYPRGDWCDAIDGLYWRFIDKHIEFYKKNPRMAVMTKTLGKIDPERKKRIFSAAEDFIERTTSKSL